MPYQIVGIDVHKKMLAVVVADVSVNGDYRFEHLKIGTSPAQLRAMAPRRRPDASTWPRRSRTAASGDARRIFPMPNAWCGAWSRRS